MADVEAQIAFLAACKRRPVFHDPPSDQDFLPLEAHTVSITAVRGERREYRLANHGLEIVPSRDALSVWRSTDDRAAYLRMLEETLRALTGANRVVALGNGVVRRSERSARHGHDGTTVLGRFAHSDFSRAAAGSRSWVEYLLPREEALHRLAGRYAIYNVWQSLTDPPQDTPLAFCDSRSVAPDHMVGCDQVISGGDAGTVRFELSLLRHDPGQHWFYVPHLGKNELLVFTGYDSDPDRPQSLAHAAFTDPSCPPGVAPRESIDERLIAFFD